MKETASRTELTHSKSCQFCGDFMLTTAFVCPNCNKEQESVDVLVDRIFITRAWRMIAVISIFFAPFALCCITSTLGLQTLFVFGIFIIPLFFLMIHIGIGNKDGLQVQNESDDEITKFIKGFLVI